MEKDTTKRLLLEITGGLFITHVFIRLRPSRTGPNKNKLHSKNTGIEVDLTGLKTLDLAFCTYELSVNAQPIASYKSPDKLYIATSVSKTTE